MIELGNFQYFGYASQNNDKVKWDIYTDLGSLRNIRPGVNRIIQQYDFGNFNWTEAYIRKRFALAEQYADKAWGLIFLMQEETYMPSKTPQTKASTTNGKSYVLEGITIPAMPGDESTYFVALLKAWKNLCVRLGKKAVLCGSPAVCTDDAVWTWDYSAAGVDFIAKNFDALILYHYPNTVALAQGAGCTQQNKNPGKRDAKSYIQFWRNKNPKITIFYILITKFTDYPGSTDIKVVEADFINAANTGANVICCYPYIDDTKKDTNAVRRMIDIYTKYNLMLIGGTMTTIAIFGDAHTTETNDRVVQLTSDMNNYIALSPTGQIDAIFTTGDMETVIKVDQAHQASTTKNIPLYFNIGNHDIGDIAKVKTLQPTKYPVHPGPMGTEKTSFSLEIGDLHIVILNAYWDGKTNEGWMGGGSSGGEIGTKLLAWIQADLQSATTKYKIVMEHEPMYPDKRHKGNSLDWNIPSRDALQAMLDAQGVDAFFAGHSHFARGDLHGRVLQVQDGVPGTKAGTNGDPYRSVWFVHIDTNGNLIVTWKHNANSGSSWSNPTVKTWTLPQDSITPSGDMTLEQLKAYDGKNGVKAYVAIDGKIIHVTSIFPNGIHQGIHTAGQDLTSTLIGKHGLDKIAGYTVIGNLIPTPPPEEIFVCEQPLNGWEIGDKGTRRQNPRCNLIPPPIDPNLKPVLVSMTPTTCKVGEDVTITLTGTDFTATAYPNFYSGSTFIDHGILPIISGTSTKIVVRRVFTKAETMTVKINNRNKKLSNALPLVVTSADTPPPEEIFMCEEPLNGWEIGNKGTRRQNPRCNPIPPPIGEFDLTDLVKVEQVLKGISDLLDSIRKK